MSARESLRTRLTAVRADPQTRWLTTLAAVSVGLAVAQGHWLGLVVGGALTALPQSSGWRGLAAGVGSGVAAWLVFLAGLWWAGVVGLYPAMGQVTLVAAAIPVVCGLLGGLVRGLV